jgi:hypothetical protein
VRDVRKTPFLLLIAALSVVSGCGGHTFQEACERWARQPEGSYQARAEFAREMSELTDGDLAEDFRALERTLNLLSKGDLKGAEFYEVQTKISQSRVISKMSECSK